MSFAVTAIVVTAVGTGVSIYGQQQQAEAQQEAAEANARQLELTAQAREAEAHEDIVRQQREARRIKASMRATMADSGTRIDEGSNLEVLGAATTRLETRIADYARQTTLETRSLRYSAAQSIYEGEQARVAANINSTATLVSSLGSMGNSYYNYSQAA